MLGAACALAASDTTMDIVLNSLAISFVYSIDTLLYKQLVSANKRQVRLCCNQSMGAESGVTASY